MKLTEDTRQNIINGVVVEMSYETSDISPHYTTRTAIRVLDSVDHVLSKRSPDADLVETIERLGNENVTLRADLDTKVRALGRKDNRIAELEAAESSATQHHLDRERAKVANLEVEVSILQRNLEAARGGVKIANDTRLSDRATLGKAISELAARAEEAEAIIRNAKLLSKQGNLQTPPWVVAALDGKPNPVATPTYVAAKRPEGAHELIARHRHELNDLELRLAKEGK